MSDPIDLSALSADELRAFAADNGIKVNPLPNLKAETLLAQIQAELDKRAGDIAEGQDAEAEASFEAQEMQPVEASADEVQPASDPVEEPPAPARFTVDGIYIPAEGDPPAQGYGQGDPEPEPAPEESEAAPVESFVQDPLIAYAHPDNGACDAFKTDADGNVLALASDAATLASLGFFPVS